MVFSRLSELYEEMWKAIIRPPRDCYTVEQLGPSEFYLSKRRFKRRDFELKNKRGLKVQCSHFEPVTPEGEYFTTPNPCVIYMHGNCSSRMEAIHCGCLRVLLPIQVSVLCFDFSGSGISEGEYVSLGWYEREDLAEIIAHLRSFPRVSTIGLWGRSMGAVTACLFADQDPSIAGLVVDSPFSSLRRLAEELAGDFVGWKMPKFLLGPALNMVRNTVMQKANFDLDRLEPIQHCGSSFIPALFIAAKEDYFIRSHHARTLHDAYAGDKNFILVDGNHNTQRPEFLHDSIAIFFRYAFQLEKSEDLWDSVATELALREQQRREILEKKGRRLLVDHNLVQSLKSSGIENDPLRTRNISLHNDPVTCRSDKYRSKTERSKNKKRSDSSSSSSVQQNKPVSNHNDENCHSSEASKQATRLDSLLVNGVGEATAEFNVEHQKAIWMSLQNLKKAERCDSSTNSELVSDVIEYIPEMSIDELLDELQCVEDVELKIEDFNKISLPVSNLLVQPSMLPTTVSSRQSSIYSSVDTNSNVESSINPHSRLNMIAPHRVNNFIMDAESFNAVQVPVSPSSPQPEEMSASTVESMPHPNTRSFRFW